MYLQLLIVKTNFQYSDILILYFAYLLKLKPPGKCSLTFTLNDYHVLIIHLHTYGDKDAGSMSFV